MFVEDIVRDIAVRLSNDPNITWFAVESENFESIHNHNAYAYIEKGEAQYDKNAGRRNQWLTTLKKCTEPSWMITFQRI
jgi:hypothetical protein